MEQPMNTNPVQVVVVTQPVIIDKQIKYRNMKSNLAGQLIGLGIMQLIIGILCIIFQGVAVGIYTYQLNSVRTGYGYYIPGIDYIEHGFWTGILSFVAVAMEALLAILGFAEGVVAIRSSVIGCTIGACCCKCRGACCCPTDSQYQQLHNLDQPDLAQQSFASSQQEPTFNTNQEQPALNQHQQQLMFNPSQKQLVLNPNHQPPLFVPSQQQPFNPNQQAPMFNQNQQQLIFLSTQPNVGFYPQHQTVQYYALQPITVLGSHHTDVSTILSGATGQGQDIGPLTGLRDTSLPDENTGTSGSSGSDKVPISSDDVEMLSP